MTTINPDNRPPTAQREQGGATSGSQEEIDWLQLGQNAYLSSTTYVDNNLRKQWEDGIRAFHNQHSSESKYNQPAFEKRSKLFRPKTRTIIRKNEAAAAAAFFSSMDVVSVDPQNQNDKLAAAGAEVMKALLQHRLTKSIKWFHVVLGGLQETQTMGVVCAHVYWDYRSKTTPKSAKMSVAPVEQPETEYPEQNNLPKGAFTMGAEGQPSPEVAQQPEAVQVDIEMELEDEPISDKPCVKLIPIENIRIDAAADWTDPVNTSPFFIEMMPMYIMDVRDKVAQGEWLEVGDEELMAACDNRNDSTRAARQNGRQDPTNSDSKSVLGHEVVWVQRHIHRHNGEDWEFYMLGDQRLLSVPVPLKQNVLHGLRPYVIGCCILEAHRVFPTSVAALGKGLQEETNEVANQRIDNVKFVLNKKWFVKRGKDADIGGLVRNVPGGVVMLDDPVNDVREISFPDVTSSAYEEQSRIDNDMNDLLGNFSAGQVMADHGIAGPARNMQLLSQSSGTLVEYLLRTYVETFIQPILRQLVLLEQNYETDEVLIGIAAKDADVFQRFGVDQVTDTMLEQELSLNVNVGMGATDPQLKLQKFVGAINMFVEMMSKKVPGINMQEVGKEIFGHLGYRDGSRFFTTDNPQMIQLQEQLKQVTQEANQLKMKLKDNTDKHIVEVHKATIAATTKLKDREIREAHEDKRNATTHLRALNELQSMQTHTAQMEALALSERTAMRGLEKSAKLTMKGDKI